MINRKDQIVDECTRHGTYLMDRREFDEAFAGRDLTIQVRAALDFAQQNGLAFGRSMGDQRFVFSRLAAVPEPARGRPERQPLNQSNHPSNARSRRKQHRRAY